MKKLLPLLVALLMVTNLFATPLIDAAKNQNYAEFEKLVLDGADLNEKNESGMNVQLALAYFKKSDFKKACKLLNEKDFDFDVPVENNISLVYALSYSLSYEKLKTLLKYNVDVNRQNSLTGLTPIKATQFSTFKFYSTQKIPAKTYRKAEKVRNLLLKNGSEEFEYSELTFGNVGNMFFCLCNVVGSVMPFVTPDMINSSELYFFTTTDKGQKLAVLREEQMKALLNAIGLDVEITNEIDSEKIYEQLVETEVSEYAYFIIANTGNNAVAPYQWVNIMGGNSFDERPPVTKDMEVSNPDSDFNFVDFQIKDITHLISIKVLNM